MIRGVLEKFWSCMCTLLYLACMFPHIIPMKIVCYSLFSRPMHEMLEWSSIILLYYYKEICYPACFHRRFDTAWSIHLKSRIMQDYNLADHDLATAWSWSGMIWKIVFCGNRQIVWNAILRIKSSHISSYQLTWTPVQTRGGSRVVS